jgi:hypothetical protein
MPWAVYLQVNVPVNRTVQVPVNITVETMVEHPRISYVNRTEEKIVEKIVYVEVPGPERIVYRDKTVEKMMEVPKSILVEKNLTEGTVYTCKAGYYSSTAGARF